MQLSELHDDENVDNDVKNKADGEFNSRVSCHFSDGDEDQILSKIVSLKKQVDDGVPKRSKPKQKREYRSEKNKYTINR